ncbi:MAG: DUF4919 domain-containing protein [Rikenellaceae bacterium]
MKFRLVVLAAAVMSAFFVEYSLAKVPQEEDILSTINSMRSDNHYPSLMVRFQLGDTSLTAENYHYLYYGFAYQSSYKPLETNPHIDKFLLLASQIDIDAPDAQTLRQVISVGLDALEYDPFNLKVWNMMAYAYGELGEEREQMAAYKRMQMIMATIKASGSGLKERSPQHILMFDHALDLMAAENLQHSKAKIISRTVEYIPLISPQDSEEGKIRGLYFDFGRVYWNKPDSVTYKRDQTWQFNNLKPREYK